MIPLLATGKIGILGYYFLNDPSFHVAAAEWIHANGFKDPAVIDSSYTGAANLINSGYPTGTYAWPVISITFLGTSAFAIWTPLCAITLGMLAVLAYGFVRRSGSSPIWAVPLAVAIAAAYLPVSYLLQGGLKELLFALAFTLSGYAVTTFAPSGTDLKALLRATIPAAFAISSMIVIFGPGAGVWIGQLTVFAFVIAFIGAPRLGITRLRVFLTAALWGVLLILLTLPALISAIDQLSTVQDVAANLTGIGNLLGFVPSRAMLPGWVSGDYRVPEPTPGYSTISYAVVAAAGVLVLIGGIREFFTRRFFVPLTGITAAIALAYLTSRYNAYFVAKAMVTFVPVIGCAVASGLIWLIKSRGSYRVLGVILAAAFAFTATAGFVQNYKNAWTTPTNRLEELSLIDSRGDGQGPTLLTEREDYGQSTLSDAGGVVPHAMLTALMSGTPMIPNGGGSLVIPQDIDGFETKWLETRKLIVERRGPGGSRPPSNYNLWFTTKHYNVWRRGEGPAPKVHVPVGLQTDSGMGEMVCNDPQMRSALRLAESSNSKVIVATRESEPELVEVDDIDQEPAWSPANPADGFGFRPVDASGSFDMKLDPGKKYTLWVQGQFGAGIKVSVDGKEQGSVPRDLGSREHWSPLGEFTAEEVTKVAIKPYGASSLAPGSIRGDAIRAFAVLEEEPAEKLTETDAAGARKFCGKQIDWLEVL
jgi:hypothetical protein